MKICKHCGKPFEATAPSALYCPEPCRAIVRVIQQERYRKRPENLKKAAERAHMNYINSRKIMGKTVNPYMKTPKTPKAKKALYNITAYLSVNVYTRSSFQRLSPEKIIKAMSKPIRITI